MQLSVTVNCSYMMCLKENPPSLELWQVKSWISGLYCYSRVEILSTVFLTGVFIPSTQEIRRF